MPIDWHFLGFFIGIFATVVLTCVPIIIHDRRRDR